MYPGLSLLLEEKDRGQSRGKMEPGQILRQQFLVWLWLGSSCPKG